MCSQMLVPSVPIDPQTHNQQKGFDQQRKTINHGNLDTDRRRACVSLCFVDHQKVSIRSAARALTIVVMQFPSRKARRDLGEAAFHRKQKQTDERKLVITCHCESMWRPYLS